MPITDATREILWNIPSSYKVIMYAMFGLSLIIFAKGMIEKFQFVTGQKLKLSFSGIKNTFAGLKGPGGLFPEKFNFNSLFQTLLLTGKVPRDRKVGGFHSLIYYGFIVLWIATDLVAIHYDTPFKVFKGTTYIVVSFLADIAGIAILIGLAIAYHRRYIKKPDYLSATKPKREIYMYLMLLNLVVIGYILEGLRITGTGMPIGEKLWAPVGWLVASAFHSFSIGDQTLAMSYRFLWLFHMASTMFFIASIPYTKFFHIIAAPLNALFTPKYRGAVLSPMDFENEDAETFGLGKLSEMTMKNRMDLISCVECGRCTESCPAHLSGKPLNPKTIITKARDLAEQSQKEGIQDASFWGEKPIFDFSEIDSCTTCGACMEECPVNIEHVDIIMEAKRFKTLTLGEIPPAAADAVSKTKVNGNPWGIAQEDRFNWAEGLDVPVIEAAKKVDYLYYVGCAGSYDAANQKVVKDTVMLLKKAGVSFAVMGKTEKCNGDPVRRFGDEYSFYEIAIENIANMRQYQFDKVVTHCPHCLHTIGKEYGKFEDGDFPTIHHTELLAELVKDGKITPAKKVDQDYTFHDPCYLGRHHGEYNAPRSILEAIPGVSVNEMEKSKDKSLCCGMGGGNMWYEIDEGTDPVLNRLEHIAETKAPKLATACSYCMINFNSSKSNLKETEELEVQDIASILAESVD